MANIERKLQRSLVKRGFTVLRGGWPDFLAVTPDNHLLFIEVKSKNDTLKPNQKVLLETLSSFGLNVFVAAEAETETDSDIFIREFIAKHKKGDGVSLEHVVRQVTRELIDDAMMAKNGNMVEAAKYLKLTQRQLRYKLDSIKHN